MSVGGSVRRSKCVTSLPSSLTACCCSSKLGTVATFKLKAMECNVKLLFWRQFRCHCSLPNFELHVTSHVYAYPQIYGRILNIIHKYWSVGQKPFISIFLTFSTFFPNIFQLFFSWIDALLHHTSVSHISCEKSRSTSSTHCELVDLLLT